MMNAMCCGIGPDDMKVNRSLLMVLIKPPNHLLITPDGLSSSILSVTFHKLYFKIRTGSS
ncbi:hypothetical protein HanRHA438_Chr09g0403041 [Helianthus annuus]|nr:hypothetical protein HanRHA438_Chr09g0403041 [Helianthus annuus]